MSLVSNEAFTVFSKLHLSPKERMVNLNGNPVMISTHSTLPLFCNTSVIDGIKEMDLPVQDKGSFGNIHTDFKTYIFDSSYAWETYCKNNPLRPIDKSEFVKEYNKLTEMLDKLGNRFVVCKGYKNTLTKGMTYIVIDRLLRDAIIVDGLLFVAAKDISAKYDLSTHPTLQGRRIGANMENRDHVLIYETNGTSPVFTAKGDYDQDKKLSLSSKQDLSVKMYVMGGGRDVPPTYNDIKTGVFYSWLDNAKTIQIARQDTYPIVCMVFQDIKELIGKNFVSYNLYAPNTNRYKMVKVDTTKDATFGCFNLLV